MDEIPLLGQNNHQHPHKEPEIVEARCAFLVYITKEGQTVMTPDINTPLTTERLVHQDEALAACHVVAANLQAQQGAAMMMQAQMGMAQAAMNARANQEVLKGTPNLRA
jgi:hypothetical protein